MNKQRNIVGLMGVKGSGKDTCARYLVTEQNYIRIGFADKLYQEVGEAYDLSVEFLGDRRGKEYPLPHLALRHCREPGFVQAVYEELEAKEPPSTSADVARMLGVSVSTVQRWDKSGKLTPRFRNLETGRRGYRLTRVLKTLGLPMSLLEQTPGYARFLDEPRSPRFVLQLWGTEFRRRRGVDSYWLDIVAAAVAAQPTRHFVITDVRFNNEANFVEQLGGVLVRVRRRKLEELEAAERAKKGAAAHPSETELLTRVVAHEIENIEGDPDSLREGIYQALTLSEPVAA